MLLKALKTPKLAFKSNKAVRKLKLHTKLLSQLDTGKSDEQEIEQAARKDLAM